MRVTPTRLPFRSAGVFNIGLGNQPLQSLVDDTGDHHGIAAAQRSRDQDIAG